MRPGDTFRATFPLSGAASAPTGVLLHNGVEDTTVGTSGTITCTAAAGTNMWFISVVIPSTGYAAGDTIELAITSTVSGLTQTSTQARAIIDTPVTLYPLVQAVLAGDYVVATGVTSPVTADVYYKVQPYAAAGVPYYASTTLGTPMYLWTDGSKWYFTSTLPGVSFPTNYFATAAGGNAVGPYLQVGTGDGTVPAVTVHGDAVLSGYQPNLAAAGIATTTGPVGSVTGSVGGSVASVANLSNVGLATGTVTTTATPTTTTFTATGSSLNTTAGGYTSAPMSILWQTGANATFKFPITGHTVSGSTHTFTVSSSTAFPTAPSLGDTFVIG